MLRSARRRERLGDSFNWLLIAICKITWAKCKIAMWGLALSKAGEVLILPNSNYPFYQLGLFIFSTSVGTCWVSVRINSWPGSSNICIFEKRQQKKRCYHHSCLRMRVAIENVRGWGWGGTLAGTSLSGVQRHGLPPWTQWPSLSLLSKTSISSCEWRSIFPQKILVIFTHQGHVWSSFHIASLARIL